MFTKEEASKIKQGFWTSFGRYMKPIPSSEGVKINWVNYHTGVKHVYFRMDADQKKASICISVEHADPVAQQICFEAFVKFKTVLHDTLNEQWHWQLHATLPDGRTVSRICQYLDNVSIFNQEQWPEIISFLKPRLIALDAFWENAKYSFLDLV